MKEYIPQPGTVNEGYNNLDGKITRRSILKAAIGGTILGLTGCSSKEATPRQMELPGAPTEESLATPAPTAESMCAIDGLEGLTFDDPSCIIEPQN